MSAAHELEKMLRVRTTRFESDLADLLDLCRQGRVFEVQDWVRSGKPLQLSEPLPRQRKSPLRIAIDAGNHSLVQVLLEGGFDPNLERCSPLTWALENRRADLVELLIEHGCAPNGVGLYELFQTYDRAAFERFYALGVDLAAGNEMAGCLAHSSTNKPLYGFVKQHRDQDPGIGRQLQIALHTAISDGAEAAIALCLWAGGQPRVAAPTLSVAPDDDEDDEDRFDGWTAVEHAVMAGNLPLLKRLGVDPNLDDLDSLHNSAADAEMLDYLFAIQLPSRPAAWVAHQLSWLSLFPNRKYRLRSLLERAFDNGLRITDATKDEVGYIRRSLLKEDGYAFCGLIGLLCQGDHCSDEFLRDLARTQAFQRKLGDEGFIPGKGGVRMPDLRPTGMRQVQKRLGIELPKAAPPRIVYIGRGEHEVISRRELFDRVWAAPVSVLARQWGISDQALGKACGRLRIPVPPRGYWARLEAGRKVRRPKLPRYDGPYEPRVSVPRGGEREDECRCPRPR